MVHLDTIVTPEVFLTNEVENYFSVVINLAHLLSTILLCRLRHFNPVICFDFFFSLHFTLKLAPI